MSTVKDTDSTQSEFQTGTLTDVEADSGDYLRLADTDVLSFDGSDDVVVSYNSVLQITQAITLEWWDKMTALPTDMNYSYKVILGQSNDSYRFGPYTDDEDVMGARFNYNTSNEVQTKYTLDSSVVGVWTHFAITFDGRYVYFYENGEEVHSYDYGSTVSINTSTSDIKIGGNWKGVFSDMRLWSVARTQTEIQDNMNKRLNGDETGLVAYYKLDEGSGTTATDSAETNDGTINGATWIANEPLYFMNAAEDNNRLSPQLDISEVGEVQSSSINWTETLNGQSIVIETRVSTDNGETWTEWATATNGGSISDLPAGTDASTALVESRQSLTTTDTGATPQLDSITVEVVGSAGQVSGQFFAFGF